MKNESNNIKMMIKVIKDCQEHKKMGTPNRVWSTYFRYALNELEKGNFFISDAIKKDPSQKFIYEHTVPFNIIRDKLMALEYISADSISNILEQFHIVTKISHEEDQRLNDEGLSRTMPTDWDEESPLARYERVGIKVYKESDEI